jgi:hypothetical protein
MILMPNFNSEVSSNIRWRVGACASPSKYFRTVQGLVLSNDQNRLRDPCTQYPLGFCLALCQHFDKTVTHDNATIINGPGCTGVTSLDGESGHPGDDRHWPRIGLSFRSSNLSHFLPRRAIFSRLALDKLEPTAVCQPNMDGRSRCHHGARAIVRH